MQSIAELQRKIAHAIASAPNLETALKIYGIAWSAIKDYKFVFGAAKGAVPGFAVNRQFSGDAVVRGLFPDEHAFVLDPEIFKALQSGEVAYPVDYSISLDTMAFSYLRPYALGKAGRLMDDFAEVFDFIARDDVYVDGMPYILENLGGSNLDDPKTANDVFESIKAYEVLRTIDRPWLNRYGEVRSRLDEAALNKKAQEIMAGLYRDKDNSNFMKELSRRFDYIYVSLLKLASIHLRHKDRSVDRKAEEYIDFCHSKLSTINVRDLMMGRKYFELGPGLHFFRKIQARRPGILVELKNMAWDLFHIRQLEFGMTMRPDARARYYFPALLTYDRGLIEILDMCPLKSIAFASNSSEIIPVYRSDGAEIYADDAEQRESLKARYFSDAATADRNRRRGSTWEALPDLIAELEEQVRAFELPRRN